MTPRARILRTGVVDCDGNPGRLAQNAIRERALRYLRG